MRFICSSLKRKKYGVLNTKSHTHTRAHENALNLSANMKRPQKPTIYISRILCARISWHSVTIVCLHCEFPASTAIRTSQWIQRERERTRRAKAHTQKHTIKLFCLPFQSTKRGKMVMCVRVLNN